MEAFKVILIPFPSSKHSFSPPTYMCLFSTFLRFKKLTGQLHSLIVWKYNPVLVSYIILVSFYKRTNSYTLFLEPLWSKQFDKTYGTFHLPRLSGNFAVKLGNAYLRYQNRQPAIHFPLMTTLAILAIPVLPIKWKASLLVILKMQC